MLVLTSTVQWVRVVNTSEVCVSLTCIVVVKFTGGNISAEITHSTN